MTELLLPRRGTLVAWTTQGFLPKQPYAGGETAETFTPFGIGLVQLGDDVRVEVRLTESDPAKLRLRHGRRARLRAVLYRRRRNRNRDLGISARRELDPKSQRS